jgi:hypothetical protein
MVSEALAAGGGGGFGLSEKALKQQGQFRDMKGFDGSSPGFILQSRSYECTVLTFAHTIITSPGLPRS